MSIITTLQVGLYSASGQEVDKAVSMSSEYYHNTTGWAVFSIQTGSRKSSEHEQCVLSQHYRLGLTGSAVPQSLVSAECIKIGYCAKMSHKCRMTHTSSEHALTSDDQKGNINTIITTQTGPT